MLSKTYQLFFTILLGLTQLLTASSLPTIPTLQECNSTDNQFVSKKPQRRLTFPVIPTSPRREEPKETQEKKRKAPPKQTVSLDAILQEYYASKDKADTADRINALSTKLKQIKEQIEKNYEDYLDAYKKRNEAHEALQNDDLAAAKEPLTLKVFTANNGSWQEAHANLELLQTSRNHDL